jgi:WD40 repeat protein
LQCFVDAQVWDAVSGDEVQSFQHNHIVKSVDFSRDGALFATGSNEKLIRIFDLNKPEEGININKLPIILLGFFSV